MLLIISMADSKALHYSHAELFMHDIHCAAQNSRQLINHDFAGNSANKFLAGWAVSAFFGYLKGVNNELALKHVPHVQPRNDSLAGPIGRRGDQVCSFQAF